MVAIGTNKYNRSDKHIFAFCRNWRLNPHLLWKLLFIQRIKERVDTEDFTQVRTNSYGKCAGLVQWYRLLTLIYVDELQFLAKAAVFS